jgi:hypothetical protein
VNRDRIAPSRDQRPRAHTSRAAISAVALMLVASGCGGDGGSADDTEPGTTAGATTTVVIPVSEFVVPPIAGLDRGGAEATLNIGGIRFDRCEVANDGSHQPKEVIESDPPELSSVPLGTVVTIFYYGEAGVDAKPEDVAGC